MPPQAAHVFHPWLNIPADSRSLICGTQNFNSSLIECGIQEARSKPPCLPEGVTPAGESEAPAQRRERKPARSICTTDNGRDAEFICDRAPASSLWSTCEIDHDEREHPQIAVDYTEKPTYQRPHRRASTGWPGASTQIPPPPMNSISTSSGRRIFSSAYAFMSYMIAFAWRSTCAVPAAACGATPSTRKHSGRLW